MPAVSIILPTFDRLGYLRETVAAVFAQSFTDWELIIGDDGSDEPTRAYLRGLGADPRVRTLWLDHAGSPAAARNAALRVARGEYVAFLDSDDLWEPDKISRQLAALRTPPGFAWCYTGFTRIDAAGVVLADEVARRWSPYTGAIFEHILRGEASIRTPSVLAARTLIEAAGAFDETIRACEDFDLWLRLALRAEVVLVDAPLVRVRVAAGSYSEQWEHVLIDQVRSIEKLQTIAEARWRGALRRQRARHSIALAREYAARGRHAAMLSTLAHTMPYAWPYPHSWFGALKALLQPLRSRRGLPS